MSETQRFEQSSIPVQSVNHDGQPRKDGRWITLAVLLGAMVLVTGLRLWPLLGWTGRIDGVTAFSDLPREHTTAPVTYPQTPPVGGAHDPAWQNCGVYDQPIRNEKAVHSLEHGAVWITYRPDLFGADVEQLRALARGQRYVLLSPYPGLPAPVVASAWGVQITANSATDVRFARFIAKYVQGSQTPEPGAACTGGTSTPGR